ncbi:MAG: YdiU family protein [Alcanivoracaceae bacterium]|nr:YdiU family protein [Alcanivoracaceae bacterium]
MTSFKFDNSYASLPEAFCRPCSPTAVAAPGLISLNSSLATELGLDLGGLDDSALAQIFSGNQLLVGSQPVATVYAGHQFGGFNPQLGDGRAILLGEVVDPHGRRRDIQLKGAGRTPYSRGGDGRSPLGPVMREYLVSEAMHALGVPTTRALAAVTSGEKVYRDEALPGAVLTRVAASHIRVGTFEFFAARGDMENLRRLADYVIERHYPAARDSDNPYLSLLNAVADNQVALIARWMSIGFIHGVMNTDNVLVSGETVDYGPCAFMDAYHPQTVFSSIDRRGRYAYQMQPAICQWNMARFAESLVPLLDDEQDNALAMATQVIRLMMPRYEQAWLAQMRAKLGLYTEQLSDKQLVEDLLTVMDANEVDFTLLFRSLCEAAQNPLQAAAPAQLFASSRDWLGWAERWAARLAAEPQYASQRAEQMRLVNPAVIPRNHRVQQAIDKATESGDFSDFERLKQVLATPYEDHPADDPWLGPPPAGEKVCQTFCGT